MAQRSIYSSPFCKTLKIAFILITSILEIGASFSIFSSQAIQTCGVSLTDFQPISNKQGDVLHEIIKHLQQDQEIYRTLIIKNQLAQRAIHPDIFKSMKYDCFLHVHVNFQWDLLSTIPSFETPLLSALYQKGLFLIVVSSSPRYNQMFSEKTWFWQFDRQ